MTKVYITVGISASGKSTFASKKHSDLLSQGIVSAIINRDDIRHEILRECKPTKYNLEGPVTNIWNVWKFGKDEKIVTERWWDRFDNAVKSGLTVICSDTNLNVDRTQQTIQKMVTEYGIDRSDIEVVEFAVSLEEAIRRDNARPDGVGSEVIFAQWQQWNEYKNEYKYIPHQSLPKTIMVDIDGTLAKMCDRGPFEWDKVGEDKVIVYVADMIRGYVSRGYCVVVMSGRDSVCRDATENWLKENDIPFSLLIMREKNDHRRDSIVKEELFRLYVADRFNVVAVVDDRVQVIRECWMKLGIPMINVGNPYKSF